MNKISIVFSSHLSEAENEAFKTHIAETIGDVDFETICIINKRQYSLTQAYNMGWQQLDEKGRGKDIIVFCHNDITFRTKDWGKILLAQFKANQDFDIIGIAGTDELNAHGCWWLDKNGQMNLKKMYGRVWHTNGVREEESIYHGKISGIKNVVVVDGLFFAVNGATIVKRFNEDFKGFHYYDLSFCFENYLEGCNVGVINKISVLHQSVGETNMEWEANRQQFAELFKLELPVKI
jgi:hypothetical protein